MRGAPGGFKDTGGRGGERREDVSARPQEESIVSHSLA